VRSTRDPARLATLPQIMDELRGLVDADGRAKLAATCLAAAEALQ
jgi:hypothetical protein